MILRALCEIAPEIKHWAEEDCNRELSHGELSRWGELRDFADDAAARLGIPLEWGDPRGSVLLLTVGPELATYADGLSIAPDPFVSTTRRNVPRTVTF